MNKIPVTKPYFTNEEIDLIKKSLDSGWVAQGPRVREFEEAIAVHEGVSDGIATTSCTTALHLAMVASGMSAGHDVIVPSFTFVATENAIVETGATPILVDIKRETFNVDVDKIKEKISSDYVLCDGKLVNKNSGNTLWGIVPVHEFGLCCEIDSINEIAKKNNLKIVEDAACALGANINGVHPGAFGNMACVSFHPRKSITVGEGGMVLTNCRELAKEMRELRTHGSTVSADKRDQGKGFLLPEHNVAGYNYRMTDIQGAMGVAQAKKLDYIIEEKRKGAVIYSELIKSSKVELIPPIEPCGYYHTYQSYVCMLDIEALGISNVEEGGAFRNRLLQSLEEKGIATRQGTHAVHMLGYYKNRFNFKPEDFPEAYACDHLSITLPLYVGMKTEEQEYVISRIKETIKEMRM